jgi:hypothetical protein
VPITRSSMFSFIITTRHRGLIKPRCEFFDQESHVGTLTDLWWGSTGLMVMNTEVWKVHRQKHQVTAKMRDSSEETVGKIPDPDLPKVRIIFKHLGYRLELLSDDSYRRLNHVLVTDDGQSILTLTGSETEAKIVVNQNTPLILVFFSYYLANWPIELFSPSYPYSP